MPSAVLSVATIRSEQPASTALPAKQRPGDDRDPRHQPGEPGPEREGARVERRDDRVVGVARAPAAALGEQHRGQAQALDQLEQAVLLAVADRALGAGQHRVVVGEHRAGGALAVQVAVDRAPSRRSARRRACGRSAPSARAACALRGDREPAVLDEGCPGRPGRRGSRAPCARRLRGGARPPPGARRRAVSRRRSSTSARSSRTPSSRTRGRLAYAEPVGLAVTNATLDGVAVGLRCEDGEIAALGPGSRPQPGDERDRRRRAWRWSRASSTPTRTRR